MQIERVQTEAVEVPKRLRSVDAARVKVLADSMDAIGLRQPITVWSQAGDQLDLVAGAHRLEAALLLGWEWIDAIFLDGSDIDRQLWEIDENLMRSELTATQQAEHLAKRKELWSARKIQVDQDAPPEIGYGKPPKQQKKFAADTSDSTGVSKATVNRATSRADGTTQEARDLLRGTPLDTGVYLDKLKAIKPENQCDKVRRDLDALAKPKTSTQTPSSSKIDADVKARAAKEVAEIIAEHVPAEWWDAVKSNLYSAGAKSIADQLTNITGESIMDKERFK